MQITKISSNNNQTFGMDLRLTGKLNKLFEQKNIVNDVKDVLLNLKETASNIQPAKTKCYLDINSIEEFGGDKYFSITSKPSKDESNIEIAKAGINSYSKRYIENGPEFLFEKLKKLLLEYSLSPKI